MTLLNIQGDLFTSNAPAIGHGVNIDGVMGAGVAAIVRRDYPGVYQAYGEACRESDLRPGEVLPVWDEAPSGDPVWILNMATQDRPGPHAQVDWVEIATLDALKFCRERYFSRLAIPRLGCGIGGLDWDSQVHGVMLRASREYPEVDLAVYFL